MTLAGVRIPASTDTGQPEGCPTSATIDTVQFAGMRCWYDIKKDACGVCVAVELLGFSRPVTGLTATATL
ncbi:hypothetical protein EC3003_2656 [Escherichia coli 3003]|nr:hypothetical protein EC3003_2656 [Escherichia coli 3003]